MFPQAKLVGMARQLQAAEQQHPESMSGQLPAALTVVMNAHVASNTGSSFAGNFLIDPTNLNAVRGCITLFDTAGVKAGGRSRPQLLPPGAANVFSGVYGQAFSSFYNVSAMEDLCGNLQYSALNLTSIYAAFGGAPHCQWRIHFRCPGP
jgi:hypothetical protein